MIFTRLVSFRRMPVVPVIAADQGLSGTVSSLPDIGTGRNRFSQRALTVINSFRRAKCSLFIDRHGGFDVLYFARGWMALLPVNPRAYSFCGR